MSGYEGLRVFRGRDWSGGDDDGGEGFLGTVTQLLSNHKVLVHWDMGQESTCSAGHDGKFELRVFDTAQIGIRHPDTTCTECGEKEICGMLWRCQDCSGSDLCSLCYSDDKHDTRHRFLRIDTPGCEGHPLTKRRTSVKARAIGIFPGSKVVRGKDWEWGDQDGGQGSEGEVRGFDNVTPDSRRNLVSVQWPHGVTNSYRLGFNGKVDLKCEEEEVGPFYYRDHLPLLDTTETSTIVIKKATECATAEDTVKTSVDASAAGEPQHTGTLEAASQASNSHETPVEEETTAPETTEPEEELAVSAGDKVAIKVGEEKLKELQKECGGCTARMFRCIGRTGEVTGVSAAGLISVRFEPAKFTYRFNPQTLLKIAADLSEGDTVRVRGDLQLVKLLNTRVGWNSSMDRTIGKVGRVVKVDEDGDLRVNFNGREYVFAPSCCLPAHGASEDSLSSSRRTMDMVSEIRNPADASQASDNLAMFRKYREAIMGESSKGQGYSMRALFTAIEMGAVDKIRDMCQQDPGMVERDYQGITPLIYASLRGQHDAAVTLMDLGADVNRAASNDFEKTPMSAVLEGKSEELAYLLLERGADASYRYSRGHTVAHLAVIRDKPVTIQALAKHGADLNLQDKNKDTPLHLAIEGKRDRIVETLVGLPQVDIHIGNRRDFDMIQLSCLVNNPHALALLLERDCSRLEELRHGHSTALHVAATNDHVECVRLLVINGGANIHARQVPSQHTPLHVAALKAKIQTVEALLELGAEVNIGDKDDETPLHLAIGGRIEGYDNKSERAELEVALRIQIANMLISRGAFVDALNHAGRSPFNYGHSRVKVGITNFMRHNKDIVQRKTGGDTDTFLASVGVPVSGAGKGRGQLREALKGVGLPCGVCGQSKSDVTLQPCQHKCVCTTCSTSVSKCPLCDEQVHDKIATGEDGQTVDPDECKQM